MLYNKYRSAGFKDLYGQDHIVKVIKSQIENDTLGHAYLFVGIRGVGKTSLARIMGKSINCSDSDSVEPCCTCSICKSIEQNTSTDYVEIDGASNNGVDQIRELQKNVNMVPATNKRIIIIDEVHMLTESAFNAFLKTLEEPPKNVIFILATTELNKIPATIRSRCQLFIFKRMTNDVMVKQLQHVMELENEPKPEDAALKRIAQLAQGSMRDSISILESIMVSGDIVTKTLVDNSMGIIDEFKLCTLLEHILEKDVAMALNLIRDAYNNGADIVAFVTSFCDFMVDVIYAKNGLNRSLDELSNRITKLNASNEKLSFIYLELEGLKNNKRTLYFSDLELFIIKSSSNLIEDSDFLKAEVFDLKEKIGMLLDREPISASKIVEPVEKKNTFNKLVATDMTSDLNDLLRYRSTEKQNVYGGDVFTMFMNESREAVEETNKSTEEKNNDEFTLTTIYNAFKTHPILGKSFDDYVELVIDDSETMVEIIVKNAITYHIYSKFIESKDVPFADKFIYKLNFVKYD